MTENPPVGLEFQTCLFRDSRMLPPCVKTMASGLFRCCLNTYCQCICDYTEFMSRGERTGH